MNITGLTYGRESKYLCERPLCSGGCRSRMHRQVAVSVLQQTFGRSSLERLDIVRVKELHEPISEKLR